MQPTFDPKTPKKNTTVTINGDLLRIARELGLNLSGTLEARLVEIIAAQRREQWLAENAPAIASYNERIERDGCFSDDNRRF
jgi:antitoxin CcdA